MRCSDKNHSVSQLVKSINQLPSCIFLFTHQFTLVPLPTLHLFILPLLFLHPFLLTFISVSLPLFPSSLFSSLLLSIPPCFLTFHARIPGQQIRMLCFYCCSCSHSSYFCSRCCFCVCCCCFIFFFPFIPSYSFLR